jgi:serine/threonine-protein kinase
VTQPNSEVNARLGKTEGGKYRVVRLLGEGGMGAVYEAQHLVVGRRFAIKFLHPTLSTNAEIVARFQREAQAAGRLENENIAAVVDAGTASDGAPYLVMEYLEGEDLAHLLFRCGPLSVPRATYIVIQACRGLAAAHERGIVHRDLKPENLFIGKRNDGSDLVKVLDFGIAKLHVGGAGTGLTQTGATMGTPCYMSLEQARGAKEVDHRTDIYSLGVILYEILTGTKPHPGESYNEILYHVISNEPAPLNSIRAGLPAGLAAVTNKAMAREASERYASVVDLMEALIPFAGRAVTPLRTSIGNTAPTPGSIPNVSVPTAVLQPSPERRELGKATQGQE